MRVTRQKNTRQIMSKFDFSKGGFKLFLLSLIFIVVFMNSVSAVTITIDVYNVTGEQFATIHGPGAHEDQILCNPSRMYMGHVYNDPANVNITRALVYYNLSGILNNIDYYRLDRVDFIAYFENWQIDRWNEDDTDVTLSIYNLTNTWADSYYLGCSTGTWKDNTAGQNSVTWNNRNWTNTWNTPGGDFDSSVLGSIFLNKNVVGSGYKNISIDLTTVNNWIANPSSEKGFIIKTAEGTTAFEQVKIGLGAARPYFNITYTPYITIVSPTAGQNFTQDAPTALLNISTGPNMSVCYYNNGTANFTMSKLNNTYFFNTTAGPQLLDGSHTVSFWCNQSSDGTWRHSENVSFFVDSLNVTTCRNLNVGNRNYSVIANLTKNEGNCLVLLNNSNINCNNNKITLTTIFPTTYSAIYLGATGNVIYNSTIQNCNITSQGLGIKTLNSSIVSLLNNQINAKYPIQMKGTTYTINNNQITSTLGSGIQLENINGVNMNNNTITSVDSGIYFSSENNINITNSTITSSAGHGITVSAGTINVIDTKITSLNEGIDNPTGTPTITLTNTTYTGETVAGTLIRKWYLNVQANYTNGAPIDLASVKIYNITGTQLGSTLPTGVDGKLIAGNQILTAYTNTAGTTSFATPHTINTSKSGYVTNSTAVNLTSSTTLQVTLTADDLSYPIFSSYWDNNGTSWNTGTASFNVTVTNTNGTVILHINGLNLIATNLTANVYNVSTTLTSGTYLYNWTSYGNGTTHLLNTSTNRYYTIKSDTTPPSATLTSPSNNTITSTTSQNYTASLSDATSGITNSTLNIYNSTDNLVNQTTTTFSGQLTATVGIVVNLIDGVYKWFYSLFDVAGNTYSTQNNTITIDSTYPQVSIIFPLNTTYTTNVTAINFSTSDTNRQTCWYSTNGGTTNTTTSCTANITGLTPGQGSYIWLVGVNDTAGNINSSSVTFFVDSILPTITITSPSNNSYSTNSGLNVNYTVADTNLGSCWYTRNLGVTNTTLTNCVNITGVTWDEGLNNVTIWVNDTSGNVAHDSIVFTIDTTYPQIVWSTGLAVDGANVSQSDIYYNVTVTDANWVSLSSFPPSITITYYAINSTGDIFWTQFSNDPAQIEFTDTFANGFYYYNVTACDIVGNCNSTTTRTITLDTANPSATIISPTNNTLATSSSQNYTASLSDNLGIKNATLTITNSTNDIVNQTTTSYSPSTLSTTIGIVVSLADGVYKWFYSLFDWAGNTYSAQNNTITIDTILPSLSITYPLNNSNYTSVVSLNYTSDGVNCWFYNGTVNSSIVACGTNFSKTAPEGLSTWTLYANDSAGNLNSTSVTFRKDSTAPSVAIVTPTNLGTYTDLTLDLNYTVSDSGVGLSTCWYRNNTDNNVTIPCGTNTTISQATDGVYTVTVWANDTLGNVNSETHTYTISTGPPAVNLNNPTNNKWLNYNNNILFNFTSSDTDGISTCELWGNWTGVWHLNQSVTSVSSGVQKNFNLINLTDGIYKWAVKCNDTLGNDAWSASNYTLNIDTTYPLISYGSGMQVDGANVSQSSIYINTTWTEINFENITFDYYNSTYFISNTFVSGIYEDTQVLANGLYYYNATICDQANNCNSTTTRTITLDTANPSATLTVPTNNTVNKTLSQNYTASLSDNLGIKNATLTITNSTNDIVNQTTTSYSPSTLSTTIGIVVSLADGVYKWFYSLFDWAGNTYSAQNNTITLDSTYPQVFISYPQNTTYTSVITAINFSTSDTNRQTCWYSTNGGTTNTTTSCTANITGLNSGQGSKSWLIGVNDSAGNINSTSITFFVDSLIPTITFSSPTPINNSYITSRYIPVNVTSTETNINNITIYLYNSTRELINSSNSSTSPLYINFSVSSDGVYYVNSTIYDTLGSSNSTETRIYTVDTTYPSISYGTGMDADGANKSQTYVIINTTWTETNFKNITFRANTNTATYTTATYNRTFTSLVNGLYLYNVTICDYANWCNTTSTYRITLDTANPSATLTVPTNNTATKTASQNYTASLTDNLGIKNATLTITNSTNNIVNQTTVTYSPSTLSTTIGIVVSLVDGVYKWMYSLFDWAGNTYSAQNNTITIDTTPPTLVISITNTTYVNPTITLTVTGAVSTWYTLDGGATNTSFTSPTDITFPGGSNTLTVYGNDSVGNVGSQTVVFTVSYTNKIDITSSVLPTPDFGTNISIQANISLDNTVIESCNFTIRSPSNVLVINNKLGVNISSSPTNSIWNSTYYRINETGTYNYNMTCINDKGYNGTASGTFSINYSMTYTPTNYSFAARTYVYEQKNITINLYDTSSANVNYSVAFAIDNSSYFTVTNPGSIVLNSTDSVDNPSTLLIKLQGNTTTPEGYYNGNITLTNTLNNNQSIIPIRYGIKPPSGIPEFWIDLGGIDTPCTNGITSACGNSNLNIQQGSSTSLNYIIYNIGSPGYALSDCEILATGGLNGASWVNDDIGIFDLGIGASLPVTITIAPTSSTTATQYYGYFYVHCNQADVLGNPVDSVQENRPYNKITVLQGSTSPGGGSTGNPPTNATNVSELIQAARQNLCGNNICEANYNETYLSCPADCQGSINSLTDCFSLDPKVRENCFLTKTTGFIWIIVFIAGILLFLFFVESREKNKKAKSVSIVPSFPVFGRGKKR